jgi:hypothetical protein
LLHIQGIDNEMLEQKKRLMIVGGSKANVQSECMCVCSAARNFVVVLCQQLREKEEEEEEEEDEKERDTNEKKNHHQMIISQLPTTQCIIVF